MDIIKEDGYEKQNKENFAKNRQFYLCYCNDYGKHCNAYYTNGHGVGSGIG